MDSSKLKNVNGVTNRFHKACINGKLDKVCNLLRKKELIDFKKLEEKETLIITLKKGHDKVVKILLEIGVNANNKPSSTKISPLQWAIIFKRNLDIVKLLLEHGANVNHLSFTEETPLHLACMIGHLEITKELLKHNPDINAVRKDNNGLKTPLMLASETGSLDVMKELLMHGAFIAKDSNQATA